MASLIIGAAAMGGLWGIVELTRRRGVKLSWWKWALTLLAIIYGVFVAELVVGFMAEGAFQAALVMGIITGLIAVVWFVLLGRFAFSARSARGKAG